MSGARVLAMYNISFVRTHVPLHAVQIIPDFDALDGPVKGLQIDRPSPRQVLCKYASRSPTIY